MWCQVAIDLNHQKTVAGPSQGSIFSPGHSAQPSMAESLAGSAAPLPIPPYSVAEDPEVPNAPTYGELVDLVLDLRHRLASMENALWEANT